ncbi:zinc-binding alcohol dehydrogenase [Microbacterium sp. BK668]|uniref:zinc-dependent alcohol dehydrogenase n=1 Tax=Microbacterium sp. BK668 TaxID=2512118 RepID=UPI001060C0A6|nr:zinc-binding alcohol dehydrogenase [Microbacterium sp. BK668]TDN91689.1 threonine dehydrogenase-like Zn-dependent dehydrogenase [Microbacterium sp. BK668]
MRQATAFWVEEPGRGALRVQRLAEPRRGEVLVRTLYTGISRGTESVVFRGQVPDSEHSRMRAPFQVGDFPAPVEYGYLNVGVVEEGPHDLIGRTVFTLFPHQSAFVVPHDAVAVVPHDIPARRAVLAGAVETAVNVLWDAAPLVGDRIAVVGAGMIGCAIARLTSGLPGVDIVVVDVDPGKADVCARLGVRFALPDDGPDERDLVIDTSGSQAGLQLALRSAATEGEIIEASWFGDRSVTIDLGGAFHSRRLSIRSSQVGMVAPRRRGTRTLADRMALAVGLLRDEAFDALLTGDSSWRDLPHVMAAIADGSTPGLCHTIDWRDAA